MEKIKRIRCDKCGHFVSYEDIDNGKAIYSMITPDSHFTKETYEGLCPTCHESEILSERYIK